jgi:DMSO reductase anchor subunit
MISSQIAFLISAGCIFGGALLGLLLSGLLPEGHLRDKSKDTVKVVTGMIATLAALVLGLLISSAPLRSTRSIRRSHRARTQRASIQ